MTVMRGRFLALYTCPQAEPHDARVDAASVTVEGDGQIQGDRTARP